MASSIPSNKKIGICRYPKCHTAIERTNTNKNQKFFSTLRESVVGIYKIKIYSLKQKYSIASPLMQRHQLHALMRCEIFQKCALSMLIGKFYYNKKTMRLFFINIGLKVAHESKPPSVPYDSCANVHLAARGTWALRPNCWVHSPGRSTC